ncbi:hypothetical protein [Persephonella sp.]
MRYICLILFFFIFSCAPLKHKVSCDKRLIELTELYKSIESKKLKVSGTINANGAVILFSGLFNQNSKITFFTPFGQKIAEINYKEGSLECIDFRTDSNCYKETEIINNYLKGKLPFELKELFSGYFSIKHGSDYSCSGNFITVKKDDFILKFYGKRIKTVLYKDFTAEYSYDGNKLKSIFLKKDDDNKIKIYIKSEKWM